MFRYFYDQATGEIMIVGESSHSTQTVNEQYLYIDQEQYYDPDQYRIDLETKQPVNRTITTAASRTITWATKRNLEYGTAEQQLGLLYDDVQSGMFGEAAKSSAWVKHIESVKAANPKQ